MQNKRLAAANCKRFLNHDQLVEDQELYLTPTELPRTSGDFRGRVLFLIVFAGLKDEMLEESENLSDPDVCATDIVEDLACGTRTIPRNRR